MTDASTEPSSKSLNFIEEIISADLAAGKHGGTVITRFPPEPNGYLHVGHVKSICTNFGLAARFGGTCNLRFDDTNPTKEEQEFVDSIMDDVRWLGFDWAELCYASDYFEQLYDWAVALIRAGKAFVCDLSPEQMREYRGNLTTPGTDSPYRNRSVAENLDLFTRMRAGEYADGARVLRARIDMAHPNLNLRDPVMYRILRAHHHRTGDTWCIYPTYDWTHGQSDAIEKVTHSICTLEFEIHRPLYDWYLEAIGFTEAERPHQYEFAKMRLTNTVMSKRNLRRLVMEGYVDGWDDPRMPTIRGMRRRGFTPAGLRAFCEEIGLTKYESTHDLSLLEFIQRDALNKTAERRMAVLNPLKVVITNYPEDSEDWLEAVNNPENPQAGARQVPFSRELYIERDDFMEDPPKKFFRLGPGREVRLRYAYFVTCTDVVKDAAGEIVELHCTYDPATRGGDAPDGRKVKGTLHWVSAKHAVDAEVRLYEPLVLDDLNTGEEGVEVDFVDRLNPNSIQVLTGCKLEPALANLPVGDTCQFERLGYYCMDSKDSRPDALVFNRTVALRDSWSKIAAKGDS